MSTRRRSVLVGLALTALFGLFMNLPGCERKPETQTTEQPLPPKVGILPDGARPPDVILILVDALRADRLGVYGNPQALSPTMDQLATEGVTFSFCQAQAPWTLPSVATLFTSFYPGVHKALSYQVVESMEQGKQAVQSVLSDQFITLAEVMQAGGFQTAGFVGAKFLRDGYGFGQGFDHYDTSFADNTVRGDQVNDAFLKWYDEKRDASKPMFVYLHYMDVHGPYNAAARFMDPLTAEVEKNADKRPMEPKQMQRLNAYLRVPPPDATDPEQYDRLKIYREYWVARYNAGVREMDYYLDQLIQNLKQRGVWDNAYVILVADHGEALCEHDLWEHGYSLYETDLHVPMILRWPQALPTGKRVQRLAGLIDLMPTLVEQLHLTGPAKTQGVSLVDAMSDRLPEKPPLVKFAEGIKGGGAPQYGLFTDLTKLIVTYIPQRPQPDGTAQKPIVAYQLFNLGTDPGELFDISKQYSEHVGKMMGLIKKVIAENQASRPGALAPPKAVEQSTIDALASLGYVGGAEEEEEELEEPVDQKAAPAPAEQPSEPEATVSIAPVTAQPTSQPTTQPATQPAGTPEKEPKEETP